MSDEGGACTECGSHLLRVASGPSARVGSVLDVLVPEPPLAPAPAERLPGRRSTRKRSRAWLFYAALTCFALVASFTIPGELSAGGLIATCLCALYARYLFRGGRIVLVPVPGCLASICIVLCCITVSVVGLARIA
jgi:hypothetical protein